MVVQQSFPSPTNLWVVLPRVYNPSPYGTFNFRFRHYLELLLQAWILQYFV